MPEGEGYKPSEEELKAAEEHMTPAERTMSKMREGENIERSRIEAENESKKTALSNEKSDSKSASEQIGQYQPGPLEVADAEGRMTLSDKHESFHRDVHGSEFERAAKQQMTPEEKAMSDQRLSEKIEANSKAFKEEKNKEKARDAENRERTATALENKAGEVADQIAEELGKANASGKERSSFRVDLYGIRIIGEDHDLVHPFLQQILDKLGAAGNIESHHIDYGWSADTSTKIGNQKIALSAKSSAGYTVFVSGWIEKMNE
jgi:hypothetical protein